MIMLWKYSIIIMDKKELQKQLYHVIRLLKNPLINNNELIKNYTIEVLSDTSERINNLCNELSEE